MNLYKQIKSLLPIGLKYPFWFVFKAPQRSISKTTLLNDLRGGLIFIWHCIFPQKKLMPITICTGIANRSNNYLERLLPSILKADHKELIQLSVFDCGSKDVSSLEEAIRSKWTGELVFHSENIPFARSYTFNRAVNQATSSIVFICDADMSVPTDIVTLCNQYTGFKRVWYPIYFFLYKDKPAAAVAANGVWEQYGSKGMFAARKKDYITIGGLNEKFKVWGDEDTELWERFHQAGFVIIRNRQKNFFHHWHNSLNPKYKHMNDE
jgi:glycosyltransferase involved in cell wall biosynthesis